MLKSALTVNNGYIDSVLPYI